MCSLFYIFGYILIAKTFTIRGLKFTKVRFALHQDICVLSKRMYINNIRFALDISCSNLTSLSQPSTPTHVQRLCLILKAFYSTNRK